MATRESIMTALLSTCSTVAAFNTVTRVVVSDPDFATTVTVATPPQQPALVLLEDSEHHVHSGQGLPTKRTLSVMLMIWQKKLRDATSPASPDSSATGASIVNTTLESVEAVFKADNLAKGTFTLGGLVDRCWIEGTVTKISGDLDPEGQTFLAIPVSILMP